MIGAVGGGLWTGLAFEVLVAGTGELMDLAALLIAGLLLVTIAWYVWRAGGWLALLDYLVLADLAAIIGPALVF